MSDVIEEELLFPVGTLVICKNEVYNGRLDHEKGGAGFRPGKQFIVQRVSRSYSGHYILWPLDGHGVYQYAVELNSLKYIVDIINKELSEDVYGNI